MRSQPASPAVALKSVAGRYSLPRPWEQTQEAPVFAQSVPETALYGVVDDVADAEVKLRRVETILFLAREPLNSRKISQLAGLADGTEARTLVRKLNQWYDQVGRSFRAEEVAGGYQLLTRRKFANWVRRLGYVPAEIRLSAPALETLSVVAYRQPVLRADVEAIRGVNSGEILRVLMERELVKITGRSEELGRPLLYGTTRKFLEVFGLMHLEELPRAQTFRQTGSEPDSAVPPLPNLSNTGYTTDTLARHTPKESDVSVLTSAELLWENEQAKRGLLAAPAPAPRMEDEDEDFDEEFEDDDDEDDDDLDDEDDELEDDEEEEDLDDVDEDFDDEWEEVDDEDELEEDDDEEDEDDEWEDDDDDDDDEWEEEEKEEDED